MNRFIVCGLVAGGVGVASSVATAIVLPRLSHAQTVQTGTVTQVWEDGFRLNTGDRTFRVDTWEVYGDSTASHVAVGDVLRVTGEFDGGEFDATTVTATTAASTTAPTPSNASTTAPVANTPAHRQGSNTHTGTVERVWEDGFQLNTGDRTFPVDSWDVYGDNTASYVAVGDRLVVTGEFEGGEFDAATIRLAP